MQIQQKLGLFKVLKGVVTMKQAGRHTVLAKLEIFSVVILSLAAVATAWSAYQATLWSGNHTFLLADANRAWQMSALKSTEANLRRLMDGVVLMQYLDYFLSGQHDLADFYFKRFRPELKVAVESWLATNPMENPEAPPHPMVMKEYVVRQLAESGEFEKEAHARGAEAENAKKISNKYTMLTVLFAVVLLFGGVASKFEVPKMRMSFLIFAAVVFFVAVGILCKFPVVFN